MNISIEDQTLAMAAMFMAANEMHQWANTGHGNHSDFETLLESLFQFEPHRTLAAYGHVYQLKNGLELLRNHLKRELVDVADESREILRYVISMMFLQGRLQADTEMTQTIGKQLEQIHQTAIDFQQLPITTISRVAGLYQDSIGQIQPRVMVRGDETILTNPDNAARVRVLLFTGVRAAFLWRHSGGRRWRIFLQRKKYVKACEDWLNKI